jgi:menaquinone-dependent protoporphyrinogen IX oxidase
MYEVIYYSMGGNTKKIAEAIAGELGVEPEGVMKKESPAKDSLIFLGSGIYNGSSRIHFQYSTFSSLLRLKLIPFRNELLASGYMDFSQG